MARYSLVKIIAATAAALVFATSASAIPGPPVGWSKHDVSAALRSLGYPKAHPKTLSCQGRGPKLYGLHSTFQCTGSYARGHRRFWVAGVGYEGWLCAGQQIASCKVLKRAFFPPSEITRFGGPGPSLAGYASRGYVDLFYAMPETYGPQNGVCPAAPTGAWNTCYAYSNNQTLVVTVRFRHVKLGYIATAKATTQPA